MNINRKKGLLYGLIGLLTLVIVGIIGLNIYALDYYRASDYVTTVIESSFLEIVEEGSTTTIYPSLEKDLGTGLIFYPGGKVEALAYMPLMLQFAEQGLTCVLIEMPLNLAVFDVGAASEVFENYPEVDEWYLSGHSLGGAMASSYVEKNYDKLNGLILLGAYPINQAPLNSLVLYGTYDIMLDLEKAAAGDVVYEIIDGNHAQFGDYGEQEGDGTAKITREEQQRQTVEQVMIFIQE